MDGEGEEGEGDETHKSVGTATFKRKSSVPNMESETDYSKLIDNSVSNVQATDTKKPSDEKRRHKSSLSMVDEMHLKRLSQGDFEKLQGLMDADETLPINPFNVTRGKVFNGNLI